MNEASAAGGGLPGPDRDLCEYVVVSAPSLHELDPVTAAVGDLVRDGAIRLLDVAVLVRPAGGTQVQTHEADDVPALAGLARTADGVARLSQHDLDLAAVTLAPGSATVMLLVEDRWAGSLSTAVRDLGGRLSGGERIGRTRLSAQLDRPAETREDRPDLLARGPAVDAAPGRQPVDPTHQIRTLADLVDHGVLSLEQYEVQRRRVLDG